MHWLLPALLAAMATCCAFLGLWKAAIVSAELAVICVLLPVLIASIH